MAISLAYLMVMGVPPVVRCLSCYIFEPHPGQLITAQVVAKRLLHYIAAGLLSPADLAKHRDVWLDGKKESLVIASASLDFLFKLIHFRCGFSMITLNWCKISNNFISGAMLNISQSCRWMIN